MTLTNKTESKNMIEYTVRVSKRGDLFWFINDKLHRKDGPAIEKADGYKAWYIDNKLHRKDGPAVEYASGYKAWYLNGKPHRKDGPAVESSDGRKYWYLDGVELTEEQHKIKTRPHC